MGSEGAFDGVCPWCGLTVDAGFSKPPARWSRRCPCGAVALGAPAGSHETIDAMIVCYGISPSLMHGDIYAQTDWLRDFSIETRPGGRGASGQAGEVSDWTWFKRELPWQPPAGPMTDEARLTWLKSQGEAFYDRMYDSRNPDSEFRQAKEAFEGAIALARRLGRTETAAELAARLEHVRQVFRSQFSR
jgi:hypothetical protein